MQVSDSTYRRIEERARPFEDTEPEDVIRRLLDQTEASDSEVGGTTPSPKDLVSKGGRIPHGSKLRMKYKGKEYRAVVDNGEIRWNGQSFDSPSRAAVAIIQSTGADRTTADGWRHWEVKTPESGVWRLADKVRNGEPSSKLLELMDKLEKLSESQKKEIVEELELLYEDSED